MNSTARGRMITPGQQRNVFRARCGMSWYHAQHVSSHNRRFFLATRARRSCTLALISGSESRASLCRSAAVDAAEAEADLMELELKVEGMVCDGCSTRVADALKAMDGVDKVDVDLSTGIATVELQASDPMDAAFNKMPKLVEKVGKLGFKAQAHFEDW